jgi:hypothetical protein
MTNKAEQIKELAAKLREMVADGDARVSLNTRPDCVTIDVIGVPTYAEGVDILRGLGIGKWRKSVFIDSSPWSTITGFVDDVQVTVFCQSLPPTCRIEKFVERVPKTQTVESGEFIEVQRTRVVCGQED